MTDPILCPDCGHDIDDHTTKGCLAFDPHSLFCLCYIRSSDIARAYGEERFNDGWKAHELRWAVGHSE